MRRAPAAAERAEAATRRRLDRDAAGADGLDEREQTDAEADDAERGVARAARPGGSRCRARRRPRRAAPATSRRARRRRAARPRRAALRVEPSASCPSRATYGAEQHDRRGTADANAQSEAGREHASATTARRVHARRGVVRPRAPRATRRCPPREHGRSAGGYARASRACRRNALTPSSAASSGLLVAQVADRDAEPLVAGAQLLSPQQPEPVRELVGLVARRRERRARPRPSRGRSRARGGRRAPRRRGRRAAA